MMTENYRNSMNTPSIHPYLKLITTLLSIVGALNWGLIGLNNFNLVAYLFGPMSTLSRIVYILVGISGFYLLGTLINTRNKR